MDTLEPIENNTESNAESYYFAYSATLRVFGTIPDSDAISALLNLHPSHTHRKGERGPGGKICVDDMWAYRAPVERAEPLYKHIDELWTKLKPNKALLLELKKSVTVDVFPGYRSDCDSAGLEVPHTSLEMFRELEIPFGLSIIVA